jgi:hypothetical protein
MRILWSASAFNYESALKQLHVREMDFTGRPMKGYVFAAAPGIESNSSKAWIAAGIT